MNHREEGQGLVEYVIIAAAIVVAVIIIGATIANTAMATPQFQTLLGAFK